MGEAEGRVDFSLDERVVVPASCMQDLCKLEDENNTSTNLSLLCSNPVMAKHGFDALIHHPLFGIVFSLGDSARLNASHTRGQVISIK